jgi:hypothetical protein
MKNEMNDNNKCVNKKNYIEGSGEIHSSINWTERLGKANVK